MPLLYLSAAFIIGIILGKYSSFSWIVWAISGIVFLIFTIIDRILSSRLVTLQRLHRIIPVAPALILLFIVLGGGRYLLATPPVRESDLAWYNDQGEYTLVGTISAPPETLDDQVRYEISISELTDPLDMDYTAAARTISGKALVTMARWQQWEYGDQLLFIGKPLTPRVYPDFSYKDYLAQQGIQSVIYYPANVQKVGEKDGTGFRRWLISSREKARVVILSLMPQPESGLLAGILLGLDNDIPPSLKQAYRDTGTSHIIAISGFNMTLIATLLILAFSRIFRRYWGILAAIVVISIYTLFVDGSSSVTRAAIMASTAAVAYLIGRRQSGLNALSFTAAILCLFNPLLVWNVSFQLSFMAVLGLVIFGQPLQNGFTSLAEKWVGEEKAARISSPASEYFLFTLAAQLTTLPVIAIQFKRISLVSLLANPLILPAQPAILEAGMITTLAGLFHPVFGKFCAMFTWPLLAYTNFVVSTLGKIKGAAVTLHPLAAFWILLAVLLVLLVFLLRNFFKKQFGRASTVWLMTLLIAGSFSAWSIFAHRPDGKLHIHLLRTGETSAIFLQSPAGSNLLVDLPGNASETSAALMPFLSPWSFHLDTILLTKLVNETALEDLNQMLQVRSVFSTNSIFRPSANAYPLQIPENTNLLTLAENDGLEIEPGFTVTVIGEAPEQSAYAIQFKEMTILIPAGVDYALLKEQYSALMAQPDVLVLTPDDISYIPPRLWVELAPRAILWNSLEDSPFEMALSLTDNDPIELISDGIDIWQNPK